MGYCAPKKLEVKETTVGAETHKTVLDKNTELEWLWEVVYGSWDSCDNLDYAGHTDWRIPSIKELRTISSYMTYNNPPTYMAGYFDYYSAPLWSANEDAGDPAQAWYLGLDDGMSYNININDYSHFGFLCVRGEELPENDFEEIKNVDGEPVIKDLTTNLYWQKNYVDYGWRQGLAYCENLVYGGYDDWRVPNINELVSIVDYTVNYTQSIPTVDPLFDMPEFNYSDQWNEIRGFSSTTYLDEIGMFYKVNFASGRVEQTWKGGILHCVRSDLCDAGTFWDGKNCAVSPCATDSCTMEHSNGICTPKNSHEFECGCVEGFRWNSSDCVADPCFDNKCAAMRGSDGECIAKEDGKFECGCNEGYFWSISSCRKKAALGSICTGASVCIGDSGTIDCPSEGEAFYGQDANYAAKGACVEKSLTSASSSTNEEVVIDNNTGLMWQKEISSNVYTFNQAVGYCSDLEYAGYTDWRLPNPIELQSIIEFGEKAPLEVPYFYYPLTDFNYSIGMWSSLSSDNSSRAYYMELGYWYDWDDYGYHSYPVLRHMDKTDKTYVRCVRGDVMKNTLITWTENGNKLKVDTESGLMFDPNWKNNDSWESALRHCEDSDYAGYTDWRLANVNEIRAFEDLYMKLEINDSYNGTSTPIPNDFHNTYWTGPYTFESNWLTDRSICVRSGNVPKDFTIEEQINTSCSEMVNCMNNCDSFDWGSEEWSDCREECGNNTAKEAKYQYEDLNDCIANNAYYSTGQCYQYDENDLHTCLLSACATEFATCFANAGEGPHCLIDYGMCYSAESVDTNKNCIELTQCIDSCGENYSCQLACKLYSTSEAKDDYEWMSRYRDNECYGAADFEGCMIFYPAANYEKCYGEADKSCGILAECLDSCADAPDKSACEQECHSNATSLGEARFETLLQCIHGNNCTYDAENPKAYTQCLFDNCGIEVTRCYASGSKYMNCGELDLCISRCGEDEACKQTCYDNALLEGEFKYNELLSCYDDYYDFCSNEENLKECLNASCQTEHDACYEGEVPGTNMSCTELANCLGNCSSDSCRQTCYDNTTSEGLTRYNDLQECFASNNDFCKDDENPTNCLYYACQTEYNTCHNPGGATCSYSGTDIGCYQIIECINVCGSSWTECVDKGTSEAQYLFWDFMNCNENCVPEPYDQQAYDDCFNANCMGVTQACING